MRMRQGLAGLALAAAILFAGGHAFAESAGDPASAEAPKCLKAEVNPVTGHALCIDPIGAPASAGGRASSLQARCAQQRSLDLGSKVQRLT